MEQLEKKIEYLEKEKKSNNIIIHGLKEGEKTNTELIKYVEEKFITELNISIEAAET